MNKKILQFIIIFFTFFLMQYSSVLAQETINKTICQGNLCANYDVTKTEEMIIENGERYIVDQYTYSNCNGDLCAYDTINYERNNFRKYEDYSGYVPGTSPIISYVCVINGEGEKECQETELPAGSKRISESDCIKSCLPSVGGIVFIDEDLDGNYDAEEVGYPGESLGTYESCNSLLSLGCSDDSCEYGEQCVTDSFCCFLGIPIDPLDNDGNINSCSSCGFLQSCSQKSICCSPNYQGLTITVKNNNTEQEYILTSSTVEYVDSLWNSENKEGGIFNSYEASASGIPNGTYTVELTPPTGYYLTSENPKTVTIMNNPITVNFGLTTIPITPTVTPIPITPTVTPIPLYSISGIVFLDDNENGQREEYEPCYNGLVNIAAGDKIASFSSTTECNRYLISGLNQCTADVQISLPSGYKSTGWYGTNITGENISGVSITATDDSICQ